MTSKNRFLITSIKIFALFLLVAIGLSGCKNLTTKEINSGVIEYDISYPNPSEVTMSMDLMPKTLTYRFNEHNTCSEISAGMGALKTIVLTSFEKKNIIQTLNLLGKKYKVEFNKATIDSMFKAEPSIKFETTNETKKIAGYDCFKVKCSSIDANGAKINYEIYYTKSIKAPHVNWFNVYKDIDGMLMQYRVKRYGITMNFTAKTVSPDGADDSVFKLEGEYKDISASEMDSYFKMY
jgi:GLPGLI family protein